MFNIEVFSDSSIRTEQILASNHFRHSAKLINMAVIQRLDFSELSGLKRHQLFDHEPQWLKPKLEKVNS